jgi:miniconductance mechanosensitive channel
MLQSIENWLIGQGIGSQLASLLVAVAAGVGIILLGVLADWITRKIILATVHRFVVKSKSSWDDALMKRHVFTRIAHLAPIIIVHVAAPFVLADYPRLITAVETVASVIIILIVLWVLSAVLSAALDIYGTFAVSRRIPLNALVQVIKFLLTVIALVVILSHLLGRSPLVFISGLGAFTAVLMLIFKDSILGLVAGIQLMTNDLVRVGDWIEMPKYGADGDVIEVNLTTVKVQNWNKTIASIPAYALISDSFKNWRGMEESGGRRIKRSVAIDMNSIRFCTAEMLDRFKRIHHIKEYVERMQEELAVHNQGYEVDEAYLINGRHLTNVGTFRAYLEAYLRHHPEINLGLTFLVRQLPPSPQGLPIEIYVFSTEQAWARYEAIQADIFDHVLAVVPLFDLAVYQEPSGADLRQLAGIKTVPEAKLN